jgi:polygalacturonase
MDRITFLKNIVALFLLALYGILNAQIKEPVYNVRNFGAKGDGKSNDQLSIQMAIDTCKKTGGTVLLQKGIFLSGQLVLSSNITLYIDSTATLLGIQSDDERAYPHNYIETAFPNRMRDDCQRRLIYGSKVHNITITGGGTIDGQGDYKPWMHVKELGTEKDRPSILAFVSSENVTINNINLVKPACWTQVYIECKNIVIRNQDVYTGKLTPNRDGLDIVDCHNVLIEGCRIKSEDDGICFKSGSEFGCKDVVVKNCTIDKLTEKAGNCLKFGTDGLGCFMNFDITGLTLINTEQNSAIAIESMDGAVVDNINISDCSIENCGQAIFIILADRKRTVPGRKTRIGSLSNITFKNLKGSNFTRQYPSIITGIKGHNIQNVSFENIDFMLKGGINTRARDVMEYDEKYPEGSKFGNTEAYGFFIRHTDLVTFKNCKISTEMPDTRDRVFTEDVGKLKDE